MKPVETHGLTHITLAVRDPEVAMRFYAQVFGYQEYFRDELTTQAIRPGHFEVMAFEKDPANAGRSGGIRHFGFRLHRPGDLDMAVVAVIMAGGKLLRRGEFAPGLPFAYFTDPDGYEIEVWFE